MIVVMGRKTIEESRKTHERRQDGVKRRGDWRNGRKTGEREGRLVKDGVIGRTTDGRLVKGKEDLK